MKPENLITLMPYAILILLLRTLTSLENFKNLWELQLGEFTIPQLIKGQFSKVQFFFKQCGFFSNYVKGNLRDAANQEALGITILIVVLAVSPVIIWLVHNAVATIQVNLTFSTVFDYSSLCVFS